MKDSVIDTHVPFVGKIDYSSPLEWFVWGGVLVAVFFTSGFSRYLIVGGFLAARRECLKRLEAPNG